jgi:cytochrome c-type biogenesis protein CcmH
MRNAIVLVLAFIASVALAIDSGPAFEDPILQQRYDNLVNELRCLVCQNNSIADSNAMLASDLRREVRELIQAGRTDSEIRTYMTDRYGDFVLYRPPVSPRTWLLWAAPALLLLSGIGAAAFVVTRRARAARADPASLDEDAEVS